MEKSQSRIQKSNQKEQEGRQGKICQISQQQYAYKSSRDRVRQLKGKYPKEVNFLEVNGAQYKDSKSIVNKIGDTLAELSPTQNYDSTFLKLKQREEQETIHVSHFNKGSYNRLFSKDELT